MAKNIIVKPVNSWLDRHRFVTFPKVLYAGQPHWIPSLISEEKKRIKKNPFFKHGEAQFWLAYKEGKLLGRISAQINFLHNENDQKKTGHFGFFECVNDPLVARELIQTAEGWLKEKGMDQITGPFSLSANEESGLLVDGFDQPLYPLMPIHHRYYENFFLSLGYSKIKDLYAWDLDCAKPIPALALEIAERVRKHPGLAIREVSLKNMERDVRIVVDVINMAFRKNWGFIPLTEEEIKIMAKELKMILDPKLALIAEVDGIPAAVSIVIPNYYDVIFDLNGKLFPWGWLKFLYRLKAKKIKSFRLCFLGVKEEYRGSVLGGLSVFLYVEMVKRFQQFNYKRGELSWTLEDNDKINAGIQMMGGVHYKTYRLFGKPLR